MDLPRLSGFGRGNRGHMVVAGPLTLWFSYSSLIAFAIEGRGRWVSRNVWSPTTGGHLNAIDGGHGTRLAPDEFRAAWTAYVESPGPHKIALASA